MLILVGIVNLSTNNISTNDTDQIFNPARANVKNEKINFIPATSEAVASTEAKTEVYTVQNGDTLESILIRFYGGYNKEKALAVMTANNMTNPHKLSIGQKLTIPMGE